MALKRCKVCKQQYRPTRAMQPTCGSYECQCSYAQQVADKAKAKRAKAERHQDRAKKESLKTRSDWIKDAQKAFNAYIRERDADRPCICCGSPLVTIAVGGGYDAGHYRSTGSAPGLRFHEDNCHAQTKKCNRYGAGRAVDYRIGLIARIGLQRVEALESDNTPRKWTIEDLKKIRDEYRAKKKELETWAKNVQK